MAITIEQYPVRNDNTSSQRINPVGNPNVFIVSSTSTGETNYRYVAKIKDENDNVISTIKQYPDFNTGLGIFNVSYILRDYVSSKPKLKSLYRWGFYDNFFDGDVGFTGTTEHTFSVGDTVTIKQQPNATHPSYDGVHTITSVPDKYSIVIDEGWAGDTPTEGGIVIGQSEIYNGFGIYPSEEQVQKYKVEFFDEYVFSENFSLMTAIRPAAYDEYITALLFTGETVYEIGEKVNITLDNPELFPALEGLQTVVSYSEVFGFNYIILDILWTPISGTSIASGGQITDGFNRRSLIPSSSAVTDYCYAIDSDFETVEWLNFNSVKYQANNDVFDTDTGNFLTKYDGHKLNIDSHAELNMFTTSAAYSGTHFYNILTFDKNGVNDDVYKLFGYETIDTSPRMNKLLIGPGNINGAYDVSGRTVDLSNVSYYTFFITTETDIAQSNLKTILIDTECTIYDNVELLFKDRYGSYLPFTFTLKSRENIANIDRSNYHKTLGGYNGNAWTYETSDKGITTFNVNYDKVYTCDSNWINDEASDILEELLLSPDVYAKIDDNWLPIIITDTNFIKRKRKTDMIFNHQINFLIANNK